MDERYSIQNLLALRKLTRGMADLLRGQMKELLSTLAPLFHPKVVFGNYVDSESYGSSRTGEKAFKEFRELYHTVAQSRPYNLPLEFKSPLEVINPQLEMTPLEYTHVATIGNESKTITVTSPLKWVLTYGGFSPGRLKTLLAERKRTGDELQQFVLHYLMMHIVVSKQVGVSQILKDLHFPLSSERSPEFGDLPITYVSSAVSTMRPPDDVIVESTEVSGMSVFEEIAQLEDVEKLRDPLKEQLLEIKSSYVRERQ
jgi:hypothetical protein